MNLNRIFKSSKFFIPTDDEPMRSVIATSAEATIVAWYILPKQEILAHRHPHGQDTWTILSGQGEYYLDRDGTTRSIEMGDIVIAPLGCVHGVFNNSDEPFVFISVVSPGDAGYELV